MSCHGDAREIAVHDVDRNESIDGVSERPGNGSDDLESE